MAPSNGFTKDDQQIEREDEQIGHRDETLAIRKAILDEEKRMRSQYPVLKHQDAIALGIWTASLVTWWLLAALLVAGYITPWVAVPAIALPISLLHELEHDIIHNLYFRTTPVMQHIMFFGIWVAKLSLNPWARKPLHLLHHKRSGQKDDVEERLIGLGVPNVLLRLAIAFFPPTVSLFARGLERDNGKWTLIRGSMCSGERWLQRVDNVFIMAPLYMGALAWYGFDWAQWIYFAWVAPNIWRHACLVLMSSYSHYYGDIAPHDVTLQNQILSHWLVFPLNFFCVNFGAEHIIHHFVVGQPFYLRHFVRFAAWKVMKQHGIRENDFGTIVRGNRYGAWPAKTAGPVAVPAAAKAE